MFPECDSVVSSSETAWSPQCAVERTHSEMMRPPPQSPKPRLHPSPPARWPLLDPSLPLLSASSVPSHQGTHHRRASIRSIGRFLRTHLLSCPRCSWCSCQLQGDRNQRPACPLSARLIMESVQIFTRHYRVVILMRIQLNPFQASPAASVNRS